MRNQTVEVTGKLTRIRSDETIDKSGLTIELTLTDPDGLQTPFIAQTSSFAGEYAFLAKDANAISGFNKNGRYTLATSFAGNNDLSAQTSETAQINVIDLAGYALIVQGKIDSDAGLQSHNKTTNRIYNTLIKRGFSAANILYYNFNNVQPGVDGVPDKALTQTAIENLLPAMSAIEAAPIYIFMIDHGTPDLFHIGSETISSSELDSWMSTMESNLSLAMSQENRFLIYGACYSGSFIPSISKPGRIIVTSAASDEESYKGPIETDGIRAGEFFIEEFMKQLERGNSFKGAFSIATELTETYTRISNTQTSSNQYFDSAAQHPLLDDNGDAQGSNLLDNNSLDGNPSEQLYLGFGPSFLTIPVPDLGDIENVAETQFIEAGTNSLTLFVEPVSSSDVDSAWFEVRKPNQVLDDPELSTEQLEIALGRVQMVFNPDPAVELWQGTYDEFIDPGQYEIFYFVTDEVTGNISPTKRSLVYKKQGSNQPPSVVTLLSPTDGSVQQTVMTFDWDDAVDPEGDAVSYTLEIGTDALFPPLSILYRVEQLQSSAAIVDSAALLPDSVPLFWRVIATDQSGETSTSSIFSLNTDNTNGIPGVIQGLVYSSIDFGRLTGVNVTTSLPGAKIAVTELNGEFILLSSAGDNITLEVSSTTGEFASQSIAGVAVKPGLTTEVNIGVDVVTGNSGGGATTPAVNAPASGGGGGAIDSLTLNILLCLLFISIVSGCKRR
jgi:hypothetical protein